MAGLGKGGRGGEGGGRGGSESLRARGRRRLKYDSNQGEGNVETANVANDTASLFRIIAVLV